MGLKGFVLIGVVAFMVLYTLVFQNPLFLASPGMTTTTGTNDFAAAPYLPSAPTSPWLVSGLSYSCGGLGPGIVEVANRGNGLMDVVSVSLAYGGATYTATGPDCRAGTGTTTLSIVSLPAPAGAVGDQYAGYVELQDGTRVQFSGTWS